MYLCLMYVCPDVSNSGGGDVPTSDVSKSAPSLAAVYLLSISCVSSCLRSPLSAIIYFSQTWVVHYQTYSSFRNEAKMGTPNMRNLPQKQQGVTRLSIPRGKPRKRLQLSVRLQTCPPFCMYLRMRQTQYFLPFSSTRFPARFPG